MPKVRRCSLTVAPQGVLPVSQRARLSIWSSVTPFPHAFRRYCAFLDVPAVYAATRSKVLIDLLHRLLVPLRLRLPLIKAYIARYPTTQTGHKDRVHALCDC